MNKRHKKGARTLLSASLKPVKAAARSVRAPMCAPVSFEQGTGFSPELLAQRAAWELRTLLRTPAYDRAMPGIIHEVTARAERCWLAQPRWRIRWSRARHAAPLMIFFRHWTAAATQRGGLGLPPPLLASFALGQFRAVNQAV